MKHQDAAHFLTVYIREAHPADGWRMSMNDRFNIVELQPKTDNERQAVATRCCEILSHPWPMLIDSIDDATGNAYSAFPDRIYVIDAEGKVAYKGGRGPFGYSPLEMEQALVMLLLDQQLQAAQAAALADADPPPAPPEAESTAAEPAPPMPEAPEAPMPEEPGPPKPPMPDEPDAPAPEEPGTCRMSRLVPRRDFDAGDVPKPPMPDAP